MSAICSGLEFWMAFGFGFIANALVTAVQLEVMNIERLLPFLSTLPKWLQQLIKHAFDEILGDMERKYIDKKYVTFINIAWLVAAVSSSLLFVTKCL